MFWLAESWMLASKSAKCIGKTCGFTLLVNADPVLMFLALRTLTQAVKKYGLWFKLPLQLCGSGPLVWKKCTGFNIKHPLFFLQQKRQSMVLYRVSLEGQEGHTTEVRCTNEWACECVLCVDQIAAFCCRGCRRMPGQILREEKVKGSLEIQSDLKKPWCYCMI